MHVSAASPQIWASHPAKTINTDRQGGRLTAPLYTTEQRQRRDESPWTTVQAVLAPIQFLIFLISLWLVVSYLTTGSGLVVATVSVVIKTLALYIIMITGAVWEKDVYGQYLFAPTFFWEDALSMIVLALHTAYILAVLFQLAPPRMQMLIALAAYGTYLVNAGQYLWKLRRARLETPHPAMEARA